MKDLQGGGTYLSGLPEEGRDEDHYEGKIEKYFPLSYDFEIIEMKYL